MYRETIIVGFRIVLLMKKFRERLHSLFFFFHRKDSAVLLVVVLSYRKYNNNDSNIKVYVSQEFLDTISGRLLLRLTQV